MALWIRPVRHFRLFLSPVVVAPAVAPTPHAYEEGASYSLS